jgi:hypothetical protein
VAYPQLDVQTFYDARSLRYWIRSPLSDQQLTEYFGHLRVWLQHHHEAEWLLVYAEEYPATFPPAALDARIPTLPAEADAVMLVYDHDQLPQDNGHAASLRRLGYVDRPHVVLYRTQSIRAKLHQLFPVLHPLGVALCTQWNTYGV